MFDHLITDNLVVDIVDHLLAHCNMLINNLHKLLVVALLLRLLEHAPWSLRLTEVSLCDVASTALLQPWSLHGLVLDTIPVNGGQVELILHTLDGLQLISINGWR